MRAALLAVLACIACGCKEKQETAPAAPAVPAAPAAQPKPPAPSLPAGERQPGPPMTIADANALLPQIEGTQILPLKQTSDRRQVHGTWCIDGTSADDVAKKLGQAMAQAKLTNISIRGDARKAGVAGERDGMRLSMVVSASSASVCAAPAHYFASATIYRP